MDYYKMLKQCAECKVYPRVIWKDYGEVVPIINKQDKLQNVSHKGLVKYVCPECHRGTPYRNTSIDGQNYWNNAQFGVRNHLTDTDWESRWQRRKL